MLKHLKYFSYLTRHKWFVFLECCKRGLVWQGIFHDISKFLPDEWFPYVNHFYSKGYSIKRGSDSTGYYKPTNSGDPKFDKAWLLHKNRNKHHWQYWSLMEDDNIKIKTFEMDRTAMIECLCDWKGAGRAQGTPNTKAWYEAHKHLIQFGPNTRKWIEKNL